LQLGLLVPSTQVLSCNLMVLKASMSVMIESGLLRHIIHLNSLAFWISRVTRFCAL
jgi:hypothetical protein